MPEHITITARSVTELEERQVQLQTEANNTGRTFIVKQRFKVDRTSRACVVAERNGRSVVC